MYVSVSHYRHWEFQSVCYCFTLHVLYLSESMLLFQITGIVLVRVYVTVLHYMYCTCHSVCYCVTLHTFSFSECIVQFHITWSQVLYLSEYIFYCFTLQILYLSECMLPFYITCIVLVRVYMLLFQDPVLVRGTVRTNLDPWSNHSDADIWSSIQKVHVAHCHFWNIYSLIIIIVSFRVYVTLDAYMCLQVQCLLKLNCKIIL